MILYMSILGCREILLLALPIHIFSKKLFFLRISNDVSSAHLYVADYKSSAVKLCVGSSMLCCCGQILCPLTPLASIL